MLHPLTAKGGVPPNGAVKVRLTSKHGTVQLPAFTSTGDVLYVTFSCVGPGGLDLSGLFFDSPCQGLVGTQAIAGRRGRVESIRVKADPRTAWSLLISSGTGGRAAQR